MNRYNPKEIEPKWQSRWAENRIYEATESPDRPKRYVLEYFPYPSGAAMHVGHVRNYTIGDAVARHARMTGHNVLHPMGWDAFGLPAENYAIKNGISPQQAIAENTSKFKKQLMQMGFSYDWSREINSSDPKYYRWTQWFFLLLLERGLAYQKDSLQWWCETDKTVLANEQVEAGKCWRCGNEVSKKALKQWFFKITDYADRLSADLDKLDWSDAIKSMQRNWIGRSKGAEVDFVVDDNKLTVFTTRPDTLFGATFMVVAPEHPMLSSITSTEQKTAVEEYVTAAQQKSDVERQENKEKTGVFTGSYATNPVNNQQVPIWVADYVLMGYGTGAIMAVPAHDERDNDFAKKFNLPIIKVVSNDAADDELSADEGTMVNSGRYDGLTSAEAREKIVADLTQSNNGHEVTNYKIRDWLISRQRYWGAPIPVVHCDECGVVPVPKDQLPVVLPEVESYQPNGEGTSVLAGVSEWVNVDCPQCGAAAKRETDTMDGFACSSWYFMRFADPHNDNEPLSTDKVKFWLPVDDYIGGAEHAVMHLLYARMWTKVMFDEGLIDFDEPFTALRNQGMILAPDGRKMSKSWGNTITPDDIIDQGYGADAIRIMELFIGPWNQMANWSVEGMGGCYRFLQRIWNLAQDIISTTDNGGITNEEVAKELRTIGHQTIKRVSADLSDMGFNTAIAAMMEEVNELYRIKKQYGLDDKELWVEAIEGLLQILSPFAPHITEELWEQLGHQTSIHLTNWPKYNESYLLKDLINIVVQVNGKLRSQVEVSSNASQEEVIESVMSDTKIINFLDGSIPKKTIYVPHKLVNLVV